jgi:hypothetical protein
MFGTAVAVASLGVLSCAYIWLPYKMAKVVVKDLEKMKTKRMTIGKFMKS